MRKNIRLIGLLALCSMLALGCGRITDEDMPDNAQTTAIPANESEPSTGESTQEPTGKYLITKTSSLVEDSDNIGFAITAEDMALALADIKLIFPDEDCFYVYFRMPLDDEYNAYRVKSIVMNNREYALEPLDIDGNYHKYLLESPEISDNHEYEITAFKFINEKNEEDNQKYNLSMLCEIKADEEVILFTQEHRYHITLAGQLFESVYQFNKERNGFVDLWNKTIGNIEGLDEDERSFFYFAFNCYDIDKDIKFTPEDILRLDAEYNQLTYAYEGQDKEVAANIVPEQKSIEKTIEPDEISVTSRGKRSNKKIYKYNTINKLDDANLEKNRDAENAKVLQYAARSYDWAVMIGDQYGYINKNLEAGLIFKKYDINYVLIEDFKAIHIVYRHEGKVYELDTNSLIAETPITVTEVVKKPTSSEKKDWDVHTTKTDPNLSWFEKFIKSSDLDKIFIGICVIGILVGVGYIFIKFKKKNKRYGLIEQIKEILDLDDEA